ncbi:hypothetical protein L3V82_11090 [Thiotrichales bacterium 19S3-7]|nr:hypothetical protein [Thiotrichales bacterium 19S3-7]MCF6802725.1 hypothetical protein [Thiotrichales bacterium 19S3-11]
MADILTLMKLNGYRIDEEGMCYGIAHVAIQSGLRGKFEEYLARLSQIEKIEPKKLDIKNEIEREILAFFDAILLYQSSDVASLSENDEDMAANFEAFYHNRQDSAVGNKILNESDDGAIYEVSKSLKNFNGETDDLKAYLNHLKGDKENFAALISISQHAMAIIYSNNCWHLVNHDQVISTEDAILSDKFINSLLNRLPNYIATINVYDDTQRSDKEFTYDVLTKEAISTASQLISYFELACSDGHPQALRAFCELILKSQASDEIKKALLLATSENGRAYIMSAFEYCDMDILEGFAQSIINSNVSDSLKKELLLLAIDDNDDPLIMMAFNNGYTTALKAYFELILTSNLNEDMKLDLIRSDLSHGNTLLHYAAHDLDAFKAILEYIPESERCGAIMKKNHDGDTVLHKANLEVLALFFSYMTEVEYYSFITVRNNKGETVLHLGDADTQNFILEQLTLQLSLRAILEIDDDGDTVLHKNAYYPECLKSLLKHIPEAMRLDVLLEKNNYGAMVIDYALYNLQAVGVILEYLSDDQCVSLASEIKFDNANTILHTADAEILKLFLERIPIEMQLAVLCMQNNNGDTVLSYIAPHIETLNVILEVLPLDNLMSLVLGGGDVGDDVMFYVANHADCLKAILDRIPKDKRFTAITQTDYFNISPLVIASNYKECLEVIFSALPKDQHLSAITIKDADGSHLLHRAIFTNNLTCFKTLLGALPKDRILSIISEENNVGVSVLSYALSVDDPSYLNCMKTLIREDQLEVIPDHKNYLEPSNQPQNLFHNEMQKGFIDLSHGMN